jgi:hypothetical protein
MLTDMGFDSEIEKALIVMAIAAGAVVSGSPLNFQELMLKPVIVPMHWVHYWLGFLLHYLFTSLLLLFNHLN